jgi:citrate lyase subunit beta/citryl-CoA lyase
MRWRSVLFVPADRPDLAVKVKRAAPDVVVIDLEDAVAPAAKANARSSAAECVRAVAGLAPVCIRVNAPNSEWFDDDIAELPNGLTAVVVPKWERSITLPVPVVAGLETVRGVHHAAATLGPAVAACYFGAEDYVADLRGQRTASNAEVAHARAAVAVAARLTNVVALDMVTVAFRDQARFRTEAREARALGYAGKLCIHPDQVALANEAFAPSVEELDRARRLLAAFDAAGGRTISFEGTMVDEVIAKLARAVVVRGGC